VAQVAEGAVNTELRLKDGRRAVWVSSSFSLDDVNYPEGAWLLSWPGQYAVAMTRDAFTRLQKSLDKMAPDHRMAERN